MSYLVNGRDLSGVQLDPADRVTAILQDVAVVLTTRQGSVPLYRKFGLPMRFLDMPINAGIPVMVAEVMEAIDEFVPEAEVLDVHPDYDEELMGRLNPVVEVKIRNEQES